MLPTKQKHIFITGGSSGIGLRLAKKYLEAGHIVAVCSIESPDEMTSILPKDIYYYQADVTNASRMSQVINDFKMQSGKLDIVVANAGINHIKAKVPDFERSKKVIDININGVLNTFWPAIEIMKKQNSGQLVGVSSISGVMNGLPGMSIYGASKAAVYSLCQSLEGDLKEYGITVTTLVPGFIETPLTANNNHAMPFILKADEAVDKIFKAIEKRYDVYMFPLPMKLITKTVSMIPRKIHKTIMKINPLNLGKN
ncbi:MAG: SDR family NAD(P)-dependent oxidoreductase [Bacteriovoracaceae bacterium]|jgi:NAD(P)-dependent dehydrogenase (short-subunit alcohol dehydrogenase family)|nr:SDR family NAD(P)-dependent oxidoreductase [Bacteriovoracaceae bacterium]